MRNLYTLLLLFVVFNASAQTQTLGLETKSVTSEEADNLENKVNRGIDFGISLGFLKVFDNLYEARISPINNQVMIDKIASTSFVLSTSLSVPITKGRFGGRYYRKLDAAGNPIGETYFVPFGFYLVATVNLITFNGAATGTLFNQKIDGGLGLGYRISEHLQIATTVEMISNRQPRDFLLNEYNGKVLMINDQPLTALSIDNSDYFRDRYKPAVSLKFIYLLTGNKAD